VVNCVEDRSSKMSTDDLEAALDSLRASVTESRGRSQFSGCSSSQTGCCP